MSLNVFVQQYLAGLSKGYFVKQLAVILCIFVFGAIICDAFESVNTSRIKKVLLAYPAGLCTFSVTAYAMLVAGIPYNTLTVSALIIGELIVITALRGKSFCLHMNRTKMLHMIIALLVVIAVAAVAASGLAPVSISNDSMYFFRRYPEFIVYYGKLRDQFDFWLTDTGLGSVVIDTLPPLFGFGESFGIREFFHLDFICLFAVCVYDRAKLYLRGKNAYIAAFIVTLVLVTSTPFVILGHWALANMYFMELFFIAAYTAAGRKAGDIGVLPILLVALSLLRIEGTVFAVWLVLCISLYTDLSKKLVVYVLLPTALLFTGYCLKIFVGFYVFDNIYLFLTPQKAVILIGAMIMAGVYILLVEERLKKRMEKIQPYIYIAVLILANIALLVMNSELYIGNLKAFSANLFRQSGWGMFAFFSAFLIVFIIAEYLIRTIKKHGKKGSDSVLSFSTMLTVGFVLIVIIASYGRGDILAENVGDSGNRVLLQTVPLAVMTISEHLFALLNDRDNVF